MFWDKRVDAFLHLALRLTKPALGVETVIQ